MATNQRRVPKIFVLVLAILIFAIIVLYGDAFY
jgi:hypothetical protein